jgi:hypothetical protein
MEHRWNPEMGVKSDKNGSQNNINESTARKQYFLVGSQKIGRLVSAIQRTPVV